VTDVTTRGAKDDDGFFVERVVAYRGRLGCTNPACHRFGPPEKTPGCYDWHCAICDQPVPAGGHDCPHASKDVA
jgi:hypothetical protein